MHENIPTYLFWISNIMEYLRYLFRDHQISINPNFKFKQVDRKINGL